MILIGDSGGSKLDWRLLFEDGRIEQATGPGFNPYTQAPSDLKSTIEENLLPVINGEVRKIYFYGAGVSSEDNAEIVKTVLKGFFPHAQTEVSWDLLGAARALCGEESGIACILGTGSNSCEYDGQKVVSHVPSVGWILGDEGGGAHLGKRLVVDYIRKDMPELLARQFQERFQLTRDTILEKVYQKQKPTAFLGGFSKFVFQHAKEPYCYNLVYTGFEEFYRKNVMKYSGYQSLKVHFTGSVAFYFSDILRQAANDLSITVKNILESPIAGLSLYHQKDLK